MTFLKASGEENALVAGWNLSILISDLEFGNQANAISVQTPDVVVHVEVFLFNLVPWNRSVATNGEYCRLLSLQEVGMPKIAI